MIEIKKSPTADTRTCDFSKVTKKTLRASSLQHIHDVSQGMALLATMMCDADGKHDLDKITALDQFHDDFVTGFKQTGWWDNHRKVNRHHLQMPDGVPADVNLIDVLDMIVDCVMAGMARSGSVYAIKIDAGVLQKAFDNTVELLKSQVVVQESAQ